MGRKTICLTKVHVAKELNGAGAMAKLLKREYAKNIYCLTFSSR